MHIDTQVHSIPKRYLDNNMRTSRYVLQFVIELTFFLSWLKKSFYQIPTPKCDKKDMGVIPHWYQFKSVYFLMETDFVVSHKAVNKSSLTNIKLR